MQPSENLGKSPQNGVIGVYTFEWGAKWGAKWGANLNSLASTFPGKFPMLHSDWLVPKF